MSMAIYTILFLHVAKFTKRELYVAFLLHTRV